MQATAHLPESRRVKDIKGVGRALGLTPQGIHNWSTREVSAIQALAAEQLWGFPAAMGAVQHSPARLAASRGDANCSAHWP